MANSNLTNAKKAKNDEFYTQYGDIQKEIAAYLDFDKNTFKDKVVYCNCDDPFESNFFKYFVLKFNELGLKQLITTSYKPSPVANTELVLQPSILPHYEDKVVSQPAEPKGRPKVTANRFIINEVHDIDDNGEFNLKDIAEQLRMNKNNEWAPLKEDGDFRSPECIELLKQSDIVITNPPFSLFREYVKQLFDYNKQFLIIGNINCIAYKEIFQKIKKNEIWLGNGMGRWISGFIVPKSYDLYGTEARIDKDGNRIVATNSCLWLTNLDHGRRHRPLPLMTTGDNLKYSKHKEIKGKKAYDKYDNYDAMEVPFTDSIPSDYDGLMGVPISFLDKYNPNQFEIIDINPHFFTITEKGLLKPPQLKIAGQKDPYARILIKHKIK